MFCYRMKVLRWGYVGISLLVVVCFCVTNCSKEQGDPKLELLLQKLNRESREIIMQLVVTNIGEHPLTIPHLTAERASQFMMWGGWIYNIHGKNPGRAYGPYGYSWWVKRQFKRKDLITLEPGEHFTVTLNIADTKKLMRDEKDDNKSHRPKLVDVPGEYEVNVRLLLGVNGTGESNIPFLPFCNIWEGTAESNTITFVIEHEQQDQTSQEESQESPAEDEQESQE